MVNRIKKYFLQISGSKEGGFTIIELIIAIFIISIGVVGAFGAFSMVTILTSDATDRLVATYLGQEGMEVIRNVRDNNWLGMDAGTTPTWDHNLDNCWSGGGCQVDYKTSGSSPVDLYIGDFINIDSKGFYSNDSGDPTKFKRKITISCLPDSDCANTSNYIMKVEVQVSWTKKATVLGRLYSADECTAVNCITIDGTLYSWYNSPM